MNQVYCSIGDLQYRLFRVSTLQLYIRTILNIGTIVNIGTILNIGTLRHIRTLGHIRTFGHIGTLGHMGPLGQICSTQYQLTSKPTQISSIDINI